MTTSQNRFHNAVAWATIGLAAFSLPGCFRPTNVQDIQKTNVTTRENNLGEGLYTLPFGSEWPANLVRFKREHPELRITAMYADQERGHGNTSSVVLVTELRHVTAEAQER